MHTRTPGSAKSAAFTLIEVIVALVVILVLAAVALPNLTGYLDQKRMDATAAHLALVADALYSTTAVNAYYQRVQANAGRLSQLSDTIDDANNLYKDSCQATYSNAERTRWLNFGPFVNFKVDRTSGMQTPIGMADDSLRRIPQPPPTLAGSLRIHFQSVTLSDAIALDSLVDGGNGNVAGTVRWEPPAVAGMVPMGYYVGIPNIC